MRVSTPSPYAESGVDTRAGDMAVGMMKKAVAASHSARVVGGIGGFAGLYDASFLTSFRRPLLATSTDGVGTKVAIAQALDRHDTIGHDLVGMVVDDIVVVGATPLFMTDYIACGSVVPERIATIVGGVARAASECGVSLIGGETAEHPGLLKPDEYDLAGAATGVVEADEMLSPDWVQPGDHVLALASSGLHSNGYSLARKIVADQGWSYDKVVPDFGREVGLELLEPTRLYTTPLLRALEAHPRAIHALSHVTGGGIAQNLARVLPAHVAVDIDRATWSPPRIVSVLADAGGFDLGAVEDTWNMGIGMIAVVDAQAHSAIEATLVAHGQRVWQVGEVALATASNTEGATREAKGVTGGAVRLVGDYSSSSSE